MSDAVVIVSAARTPMGGFQGQLAGVSASALGGAAIAAAPWPGRGCRQATSTSC